MQCVEWQNMPSYNCNGEKAIIEDTLVQYVILTILCSSIWTLLLVDDERSCDDVSGGCGRSGLCPLMGKLLAQYEAPVSILMGTFSCSQLNVLTLLSTDYITVVLFTYSFTWWCCFSFFSLISTLYISSKVEPTVMFSCAVYHDHKYLIGWPWNSSSGPKWGLAALLKGILFIVMRFITLRIALLFGGSKHQKHLTFRLPPL